jgi:hypothetical protein
VAHRVEKDLKWILTVLARYLGWVILALLPFFWARAELGLIFFLILIALLHFTFVAPAWCAATTRANLSCRNNAYGLLMGCHLRQHKWQKLKLMTVGRAWGEVWGPLARENKPQTIGLLLTGLMAVAALVEAAAAVIWHA